MGLTMTVYSDLTMSCRRGTRLIGHSIDHVFFSDIPLTTVLVA